MKIELTNEEAAALLDLGTLIEEKNQGHPVWACSTWLTHQTARNLYFLSLKVTAAEKERQKEKGFPKK